LYLQKFLIPIYTYPYIQEALCVMPFLKNKNRPLRGNI
jgi:hypothetical protein